MDNLLITYFSIAFLFIFMDASVCMGLKYKFKFHNALFIAIIWPISFAIVILYAGIKTKDYRNPDDLFKED